MEQKLSYNIMLSLKEICLRRVTVIFWSHTDMLAAVDSPSTKEKVKNILSELELPPLLTERMKYLVQPIGWEIKNWKWFHGKYLNIPLENFDVAILEQLCWTIFGTISYRETAKNLIRLEMLHIVQRYRIACLYCLVNSISDLWENLPASTKEFFYKENPTEYSLPPPLEFCWSYILKGEETKLDSLLGPIRQDELIAMKLGFPTNFYQFAFKFAASKGNKEATEYFFRRLRCDEREAFLLRAARDVGQLQWRLDMDNFSNERHSDTFFYLLSLMTAEQQMEILKKQPCKALMLALHYPFQHRFWDVAVLIWNFLTKADYVHLLKEIIQKIKDGVCPIKMFQECFLRGSNDFRKYFVDNEFQERRNVFYYSAAFNWMDSEIFKTIFRGIDSMDRMRLASSLHIFYFFHESLSRGRHSFVQQCLKEAAISSEEKEELKKVYFRFIKRTTLRREEIWNHFLHFLE